MKATIAIAGISVLLACGVPPAFADSETKIEESDDKVKETYKSDDGTETVYEVDKKDGSSVYKRNDGTSVKETREDGKLKREYKDEDCEQSTQEDLVTGDSKIVTKGDCVHN